MTTKEIIGDQFRHELRGLLNRFSKENGSDTPDWVLADYLIGCLAAWNASVRERERWYGRTNLEGPSPMPITFSPDDPAKPVEPEGGTGKGGA